MHFLGFDKALIEKLTKKHNYIPSLMPHGLYGGVDQGIPAVGMDCMSLYCRKDQSDERVKLIAEGLERNSDLFTHVRSIFYYDRERVWEKPYTPLHPAVEEDCRYKGYL